MQNVSRFIHATLAIGLISDLRYALRYFRRNIGFASAAVLILALGVGAATAIFSATEALLLRPLPYADGARLVSLRSVSPASDTLSERVAPGTLADWRGQASSFEAIAGYRWNTIDLLGDPMNERLAGLWVTPEFFDVFGVPLVGRGFLPEDRLKRTIVLSDDISRRHFDGGRTLVGKAIELNARNFNRVGPTPYQVLGITTTPVHFPPLTADFQLGLATVLDRVDFLTPEFVSSTDPRDAPWFDVVAKLRPGITLLRAQAEMDAIVQRQSERYPESGRNSRVRVVPLRDVVTGKYRASVLWLALGTAMLLLIACANVATLLLARGLARDREVAIRTALGATRSRLVRQFLVESLLLATVATALGVAWVFVAVDAVKPWLPVSQPLLQGMRINGLVLGGASVLTIAVALLTSSAPALRIGRLTGREGTGVTRSRQHNRLVSALVSGEVALAVMLVSGAGLLVRSALQASRVDAGFDPENVLTMAVSLPENKFEWRHNAAFAEKVVEAARSRPSVVGAAVIQGLPLRSGSFVETGEVEGFVPRSENEKPAWRIRVISHDYFDVMRIPILAGRALDARDDQGKVGYARSVVVSKTFADRFWPGEAPLGKRIGVAFPNQKWWMTVVGVAGNVRYAGLEEDPTLDVYYPQALFPQAAITLVTRTRNDPLREARAIRAAIQAVDSDAFVTDVRSMEQVAAASQAGRRGATLLVTLFGAFAVLLVVAGIYSVIAQAVVQRRLEMAIRSALGAQPSRIVALTMRAALVASVWGLAAGVVGGLALTRLIASALFGVTSLDLIAWLGACSTVLLACIIAAYVPARRAANLTSQVALNNAE
jgi:putative ABC transport system permease protein